MPYRGSCLPGCVNHPSKDAESMRALLRVSSCGCPPALDSLGPTPPAPPNKPPDVLKTCGGMPLTFLGRLVRHTAANVCARFPCWDLPLCPLPLLSHHTQPSSSPRAPSKRVGGLPRRYKCVHRRLRRGTRPPALALCFPPFLRALGLRDGWR